MSVEPRLDMLGAALGDQSRMRMLCELMDGRAHTGKELAGLAGIAPNTASDHLARLMDIGFVKGLRSGRFVYYRIASDAVADVLERLSALSPTDHLVRSPRKGPPKELIARTCYNHIAGRLGVLLAARLQNFGWVEISGDAVTISAKGLRHLNSIGVLTSDTPAPRCKSCLDWSERRLHLSGPLGVILLDHAIAQEWLKRPATGRALTITTTGHAALHRYFDITPDDLETSTNSAISSPHTEVI